MVPRARRPQRSQGRRVQPGPAVRRDRLLDRQPGQLMPEAVRRRPADQRAGVQALVQGLGIHVRHRGQEICVHRPGEHRRGRQQLPGLRRESRRPGRHDVRDRPRHLTRRHAERLPHVERHPAGEPIQPVDVSPLPDEPADPLPRQRGHRKAPRAVMPDHLADHRSQDVVLPRHVVPIADCDQGTGLGDPAGQVPQPVQRRVVPPVQILDHHHARGRRRVQFPEERREQFPPVGVLRAQLEQPPPDVEGDLVQRPQGARREAAVAGRPPPAQVRTPLTECLQQRGLAHPRLARDEHKTSVACRSVQRVVVQSPQEMLSFKQFHPESLTCRDRRIRLKGDESARHAVAAVAPGKWGGRCPGRLSRSAAPLSMP
jgi:hypothetical protein